MGTTREVVVKSPRAAAPRGSAPARIPTSRPPRRRGRADEPSERAHQRRPDRAQLGAMSERQAPQQPVPARGEPHQDPPAVARAARAPHQPARRHAIDQLDRAVMPDPEPCGEGADRRLGAAGEAAQREQELVLLGLEPGRACHRGAEGEAAAQGVAELGQRPVLRQRDVAGDHRRPVYIVSRYEFPGRGRQRGRLPAARVERTFGGVAPERRLLPAARLGRASLLSVLLVAAVGLGAAPDGARPGPGTLVIPRSPRVLVFAPHPDDETIGAGGLIFRLTRRGAPVRVVFVTNGDGYAQAVEQDFHEQKPRDTDYFVIDALDALQTARVLPERLLVLTYLVHHPTWPSAGSDRDRLPPPSVKETPDTLWSGIDLTRAELAAKEAALGEYRTQLPVLGDLLHRFCRPNELYGRVKSRVLDGIAEVH